MAGRSTVPINFVNVGQSEEIAAGADAVIALDSSKAAEWKAGAGGAELVCGMTGDRG